MLLLSIIRLTVSTCANAQCASSRPHISHVAPPEHDSDEEGDPGRRGSHFVPLASLTSTSHISAASSSDPSHADAADTAGSDLGRGRKRRPGKRHEPSAYEGILDDPEPDSRFIKPAPRPFTKAVKANHSRIDGPSEETIASLLPTSGNGSGSSCHQCKSRRGMINLIYCSHMLVRCLPKSESKRAGGRQTCRKKYCEPCLLKFYGESAPDRSHDPMAEWFCPACRGLCSCAVCRRGKHKEEEEEEEDSEDTFASAAPPAAPPVSKSTKYSAASASSAVTTTIGRPHRGGSASGSGSGRGGRGGRASAASARMGSGLSEGFVLTDADLIVETPSPPPQFPFSMPMSSHTMGDAMAALNSQQQVHIE
jgi:hypothetical protein